MRAITAPLFNELKSQNAKIDVGWLVGLVVAAGVYWALCRAFDPAVEAAAIADSERTLNAMGAPPRL